MLDDGGRWLVRTEVCTDDVDDVLRLVKGTRTSFHPVLASTLMRGMPAWNAWKADRHRFNEGPPTLRMECRSSLESVSIYSKQVPAPQ